MAENVIMINVEVRIKNEKKTSFVRKYSIWNPATC